jgi:hypothetical protein
MNADKKPVIPGVATTQSMITLSVVVAVALLIFFALRDGLSGGDVVGAAVTGLALFAVLAALRSLRSR